MGELEVLLKIDVLKPQRCFRIIVFCVRARVIPKNAARQRMQPERQLISCSYPVDESSSWHEKGADLNDQALLGSMVVERICSLVVAVSHVMHNILWKIYAIANRNP